MAQPWEPSRAAVRVRLSEQAPARELAERFGVSNPYPWKISAQRKRTGQMERVEQRHGSPSRATAEVAARGAAPVAGAAGPHAGG
ncbi:MAG: hypothetical protein HYX73_08900, partial [Acidobacteria bacterium]|nr:hypothetical protein [Acidobacteriota bacterium]